MGHTRGWRRARRVSRIGNSEGAARRGGLLDPKIGPPIRTRTHRFTFLPQFSGQHETFFLVPGQGQNGPPAFSAEELLAEGVTGSRWWNSTELKNSKTTRFAPRKLSELYESLLIAGPPLEPIDTGE